MARGIRSYSVFALLLLNTVISTIVVALVLISSLQRVADEHPRRYLSKTLFDYLIKTHTAEELAKTSLNGTLFEIYPLTALPRETGLPFDEILEKIAHDADGVAVTTYKDRYLAAARHGDSLVVLPQFGSPLSSQALALVGLVVATILVVLLLNAISIKRLTAPFSVFRRVVKNVDDGNLSYRVPIEKTYGEFHDLADSFNGMLDRLEHINTARKHMLLAIPHEVRTPLARLKVRKDLITDQALRDDIARDIDSLEDILNTILETERLQSREGKITRQEIAVHPFFEDSLSDFSSTYEGLSLKISTTRETFHADPFSMTLLIKNLVSNAIRYGRGRPIAVEIADSQTDSSALVLTIADQGVGIPPDQLPYVREPFWRLDESRQRKSGGYGLGLYLCDTIAKGHDGQMEIQSIVGAGTRVTVTIPGAFTASR